MKFQVSFKTPDAVLYGIEDATDHLELDKKEKRYLKEDLEEFASKWVRYGEYISVEFDTEAGTCVVL